MTRSLIAFVLVTLAAQTLSPAAPLAQPAPVESVRTAVLRLRKAVDGGSWQGIQPYLPPSGRWTDAVRETVRRAATGKTEYSFWSPSAVNRPELLRLTNSPGPRLV